MDDRPTHARRSSVRTRRRLASIVLCLLVAGSLPHHAAPSVHETARVEIDIDRDGERVFSPCLLVRLGRWSEATVFSPAGDGHRLVVLIARERGRYSLTSMYMTKEGSGSWVVQAEPSMTIREDVPSSMVVAAGASEFRFAVHIQRNPGSRLGADPQD